MRRWLAAAAAGLLLLSACGREGPPEDVVTLGDTSPSPRASARPRDASASATPQATDRAGATTAPAATGAAATDAPAATAEPGKQNPPKDGRYTYSFKGKSSDPTNPTASQQSFEGEAYSQVSHKGSQYTIVGTSSEDTTRFTTQLLWGDTQVQLTYIEIQTQIGTFSCRFSPALLITKFPVKAETYPSQDFRGSGNACDGKLDITVEREEVQKDAAGKSWDTWRVKVHTEIRSESFDLTQDEIRWMSPDLGMEIRNDGKQNGTVSSGAFQGDIAGESSSLLKSYP